MTDSSSVSPTPVTVARLSGVLDELKLNHTVADELPELGIPLERESVLTGFPNVLIVIDLDDDAVRVRATWRGQPPMIKAAEVLGACNEWNLTQLTPRVDFTSSDQALITISMLRTLPVNLGATDEQLMAFTHNALTAISRCAGWFGSKFPDSVTWEDGKENS